MTTIRVMSFETKAAIRGQFGRDARAMFTRGGLNTAEIAEVIGLPESEIVAKRLHLPPQLPSFTVHPDDMPPPRDPRGPAGARAA